MYARWLSTATLLIYSFSLFASVELATSITNVFNRGTNELFGSITVTIVSDDFREASNADPIFIRVTPDHNTLLAETHVLQSSADPTLNQPIHLALRLVDPGAALVADPDAVSIVRWVAGESSFWIRVQQSSNLWLDNDGPVSPSYELRIDFTIGISARMSDRANLKGSGSNLPFNTRNAAANEGEFEDAVSTLFCIDLSQSNLLSDGTYESLAQYDIAAYDSDVDLGNGVYSAQAGNLVGINFRNDNRIARGKTRDCTIADIIPGKGSTTAGTGTLTRYTKALTLEHTCSSGPSFLPSYLLEGAYLRISAQQSGFGFTETGARFLDGSGSVLVIPSSAIMIDGVQLYSEIELYWTGETRDFENSLPIELDLEYDGGNLPTFEVEVTTFLASGTDPRDEEPYDGADQNRACESSIAFIGSQTLTLDAPTR